MYDILYIYTHAHLRIHMLPYSGISPYISLHIQILCKCTNPTANKKYPRTQRVLTQSSVFLQCSKQTRKRVVGNISILLLLPLSLYSSLYIYIYIYITLYACTSWVYAYLLKWHRHANRPIDIYIYIYIYQWVYLYAYVTSICECMNI